MKTTRKGRRVVLLLGCSLALLLGGLAFSYRGELRAGYVTWRQFERLGRNDQGYNEYRHRETGIVFVSLPGGTFLMGTSDDDAARLALPFTGRRSARAGPLP